MPRKGTRKMTRKRTRRGTRKRTMRTSMSRVIAPKQFKRRFAIYNHDVVEPITWTTGGGNSQGVNPTENGTYFGTGSGGVSNITYYSYACSFALADLPGLTELLTMFQQYKIQKMSLIMVPFYSGQPQQETNTTTAPTNNNASNQGLSVIHHSVIDYTDSAVAAASNAGVDSLRQYSSYKMNNFLRKGIFKRTCIPRIVENIEGRVTAGSGLVPAPWIETGTPGVPHFGFKGIFEVFAPNNSVASFLWFKPEAEIYYELKETF